MRALILPHLLLLSIGVSSATSATPFGVVRRERMGSLVGGWEPIKNINDPHVLQVAEFAVDEHNKQQLDVIQLKLDKVVSGETQVVAGLNYRLVLKAIAVGGGDGTESQYEAVVWEESWKKLMKLQSFKIIKS